MRYTEKCSIKIFDAIANGIMTAYVSNQEYNVGDTVYLREYDDTRSHEIDAEGFTGKWCNCVVTHIFNPMGIQILSIKLLKRWDD